MVFDVATGLPTAPVLGREKDPRRLVAWVSIVRPTIRRRVPPAGRGPHWPPPSTVTAGKPVATVGGNLLSLLRQHKHSRRERKVTVCVGRAASNTEMLEPAEPHDGGYRRGSTARYARNRKSFAG